MKFREGDIVSVKLQVKHTSSEGETVYVTRIGEPYASPFAVLPEMVTLTYHAFKPGDRVATVTFGDKVDVGTVIHASEDMVWLKYDGDNGHELVPASTCVHESDWLEHQKKDLPEGDPDFAEVETPPAERPLIPRMPASPPVADHGFQPDENNALNKEIF